jgi:hypothetical protein
MEEEACPHEEDDGEDNDEEACIDLPEDPLLLAAPGLERDESDDECAIGASGS